MLDKYIDPDPKMPEFRCECGECEACIGNWEWGRRGLNLEEGLKIAEFNNECKLYNELDKQLPWE